MMPERNSHNLLSYAQKKEKLHGIRKVLFAARHPILEAAIKLGNREHEEALSESEAKYRSIFQNNHTIMLLVDLEKWSIADANPAACAFYGYSKEDLVGKSISEINPLNRKELSENLEEAMRKPRSKFYFSHRISDGRMRDVEVHTGPIVIGGKQLLYSIIHDVTEQKRIEGMIKRQSDSSALRAEIWSAVWSDRNLSENELIKNVLNRLGNFTNADTIVFFRIERKTGNAVAELEWGRNGIEESKAGKILPGFVIEGQHGKKAIDISSNDIFEKDGSKDLDKIMKSYLLIPYGDPENPEGYFAFGERLGKRLWERNDRNLLNEMARILFARIEQIGLEESLHQHEKLESLGRLAGGIAHDFNNMLTGIIGYADLLKVKENQNPEVCEYAGFISTAAKRMASLTQKLLAFARKGKYNIQTIDASGIIDEVVSVLEKGIANKNIRIIKRFAAADSHIEGDDSLVYNALLNLGLNARDAMPQGGEITYETMNMNLKDADNAFGLAAGDYLVITVRDNGTGMDEETRKKAFEPFFTTKALGKGIGLGLASVYGTVKSHHGHVEIISRVGKGTAVEICFPLSGNVSLQKQEASSAPIQGHGTVMVVDDEPLVRDTVADLLEASGYNPHKFGNGTEAIMFYEENWKSIDFVILDMQMPGLNGRACFRELKEINPAVKAMLITGYSQDDEAAAAMKDGMIGYLAKPFNVEILIDTIRKSIGDGK
ncbi:MAG: response regulator [Candidatus Micrarchaeota archaeon]|nr:response regulator [Candidatus Micrarchaeota archaeon]